MHLVRGAARGLDTVSYTHLRAYETVLVLVCRFQLEKKKFLTSIFSIGYAISALRTNFVTPEFALVSFTIR